MNSTLERIDVRSQNFIPSADTVRDPESPRLDELGRDVETREIFLDVESYKELFGPLWRDPSEELTRDYMESDPLGTGEKPSNDVKHLLENSGEDISYTDSHQRISQKLPIDELHDYAKIDNALTESYRKL